MRGIPARRAARVYEIGRCPCINSSTIPEGAHCTRPHPGDSHVECLGNAAKSLNLGSSAAQRVRASEGPAGDFSVDSVVFSRPDFERLPGSSAGLFEQRRRESEGSADGSRPACLQVDPRRQARIAQSSARRSYRCLGPVVGVVGRRPVVRAVLRFGGVGDSR